MDDIITQINHLASTADEVGRNKMQIALRDARVALETPFDTMMRLAGLVRPSFSPFLERLVSKSGRFIGNLADQFKHLQTAAIRVGVNLEIFASLESSSPVSVDDLAVKSGAAPELLGRILRYLSSEGFIQQSSANEFTANGTTKLLADPSCESAICHFFDTCGPTYQAMPEFLRETNHQSIISNTHTPFNKAFDTPLSGFAWMQNYPDRVKNFMATMSMQRPVDWLERFPLEKELGSGASKTDRKDEEKVLFVDIGGSAGHQAIGFRKKCESLGIKGRVILQDLKETVDRVGMIEGVEVMVQDFFLPQTIKGAKFYYLRNIFHDYPDEKCLVILKNLIAVMDEESRILIDEVVLPDQGIHWQAAQLDIIMMAALGAKERSKTEWNGLIKTAGLKILEVYTYTLTLQNSVLVTGLK